MIEIKKVFKNYWETKIFRELDLKIKEWNIITILWPSGSWKSTLLNMLSLIDNDYEGDIIIDSQNLKDIKWDENRTRYRWKNISFVFQNFNLIDNLTVKENIELVLDINKIERTYKTEDILKMVWLKDKSDNYPFNLSWWEKQRVAIARAFIWKSKLLLADEPTWSLDIENTINICKLIKDLNKKIKNTIVIITHDNEVAKIWDKIYELKDYKLIEKNV